MTNPSRSIYSGAPAAHGITRPFLLLLLLIRAAAPPSATAQMSDDSSYSNVGPAMVIVIIILILAFLVMGFLSVYIRFCASELETRRRAASASAAARRWSKAGLDPEVIESFPIFFYSDVKDRKIGRGGALECAVCIAEFDDDDDLRMLPCDFHPKCIDAWLASHSTCPVCRANLTPSQKEIRNGTEPTQPSDSVRALNENQSQDQEQTQISIDVEESGNSDVQVREMPKRKLPRWHSTGHSLSQPGESLERYTLRLPEEVRRELTSQSLKRATSCDVVLRREGSSRRGGGGEGSSKGRSDRVVFPDAAVFAKIVFDECEDAY